MMLARTKQLYGKAIKAISTQCCDVSVHALCMSAHAMMQENTQIAFAEFKHAWLDYHSCQKSLFTTSLILLHICIKSIENKFALSFCKISPCILSFEGLWMRGGNYFLNEICELSFPELEIEWSHILHQLSLIIGCHLCGWFGIHIPDQAPGFCDLKQLQTSFGQGEVSLPKVE